MSFDVDKLYNLLPAVYRLRDAAQGGPLKELLAVIAGQVAVVEEDLEQLYDDQFIETCAEWVVPYIGDLIGHQPLHARVPNVVSTRAEVAHTIGFRRRKGTAVVLEQLVRDVTGWPARAVEFFLLLGWTQHMNHVRPDLHYAPDLRDWERLERLNTPFDRVAHTVDVRHVSRGEGKYNIPNVGIFLWRLAAYAATDSPAFARDGAAPFWRWHFHPLGLDTQLLTHPEPEDEVTHLAEPLNVPQPISRRVLHERLEAYYGKDKSLFLRVDGRDVCACEVEACDLSDVNGGWAHQPATKIAIDPVLGRIAFPTGRNPTQVIGRFHYGFSADLGGGEYERAAGFEPELAPVEEVTAPASIQDALDRRHDGGVVQIGDNQRYGESLSTDVAGGQWLELRAANNRRPTLLHGGAAGDWLIQGGDDATVTLNGLLIQGHTLRVPAAQANRLARLRLRHCTVVPAASPVLIVEPANVTVEIDHCILGAVRVAPGSSLVITDTILDATAETAIAYGAPDGSAGGPLRVERCTVVGKVHTHFLELASNTIFLAELSDGDDWKGPILSDVRQQGCVRFSHVPLSAVVPRRFECHPKTAGDALRVRPRFTSLHYGDPGYGQLSARCADEIRRGGDDEAEMGVFHDLYQPQRQTNARVRLEEYLRFRLEAGIFHVT